MAVARMYIRAEARITGQDKVIKNFAQYNSRIHNAVADAIKATGEAMRAAVAPNIPRNQRKPQRGRRESQRLYKKLYNRFYNREDATRIRVGVKRFYAKFVERGYPEGTENVKGYWRRTGDIRKVTKSGRVMKRIIGVRIVRVTGRIPQIRGRYVRDAQTGKRRKEYYEVMTFTRVKGQQAHPFFMPNVEPIGRAAIDRVKIIIDNWVRMENS